MKTQTKHTATPWKIKKDKHNENLIICESYGEEDEILTIDWSRIYEANARHIVKCVNSHDELVEACKAILRYDQAIQFHANKGQQLVKSNELDKLYEDWLNKTKKALAKAESEE